jgi:hypothetical protein
LWIFRGFPKTINRRRSLPSMSRQPREVRHNPTRARDPPTAYQPNVRNLDEDLSRERVRGNPGLVLEI